MLCCFIHRELLFQGTFSPSVKTILGDAMKAYFFVYLFSLALLIDARGFAVGVDVGNGGDAVFCRDTPDQTLTGWYSLDYALTYNYDFLGGSIAPEQHWQDLAEKIVTVFDGRFPKLASDLTSYLELVFSKNPSLRRLWINVGQDQENRLIDIKTEDLISLPPAHCLSEVTSDPDLLPFHQAVIQKPGPNNSVRYYYDENIFQTLEATSKNIQISFLVIHEWLWDYFAGREDVDTENLRLLNRYLHGLDFLEENISTADIYATFLNLGLQPEQVGPVSDVKSESKRSLVMGRGFACIFESEEATISCWGDLAPSKLKLRRLDGAIQLVANDRILCGLMGNGDVECLADGDAEERFWTEGWIYPLESMYADKEVLCGRSKQNLECRQWSKINSDYWLLPSESSDLELYVLKWGGYCWKSSGIVDCSVSDSTTYDLVERLSQSAYISSSESLCTTDTDGVWDCGLSDQISTGARQYFSEINLLPKKIYGSKRSVCASDNVFLACYGVERVNGKIAIEGDFQFKLQSNETFCLLDDRGVGCYGRDQFGLISKIPTPLRRR